MHNVIVGTAGHVDHGKTCLIKALTGTDTDRLKEEQKRGITIELGFASLSGEEGQHIGIIDVPGHERFVKNMLAGIGGIDLVLLAVALDEGVMPQTTEHFEILKMLDIRQGILVFTKADMVDEEWADMVEEDTRKMVKGSFLENAQSVRVSSYTGQNIETLRKMILEAVRDTAKRRDEQELFRLPIDRVFSMEGFGTVVTGTLLEGCCRLGQEIEVYPQGRIVKIRGIENHGEKAETAYAGQRTALNLAGIKKEELERGEILAAVGSMPVSRQLDARVRLFKSSRRLLCNGDRVHISYGSAQSICKVVLLDCDEIKAGEEAYAQLRFDEPVSVKRGDHFIIRFYSPVETFGGGVILEADAGKHKRCQKEALDILKIKEYGRDDEVLEAIIKERSRYFPELSELSLRLNAAPAHTEELLEKLKKQKKILAVNGKSCIHKDYWDIITEFAKQCLNRFHEANPIASGIEKEELKSRLTEHFYLKDAKRSEELFQELVKRGIVTVSGSTAALNGYTGGCFGELSGMMEAIRERYRLAGVEAPTIDEVINGFKDKKQARQIITELVRQDALVKAAPGIYMGKQEWEKAVFVLKNHLDTHPDISLAEYRDLLGTSRKYAVMLLDAFDQRKITKKQGDVRILYK